MSLAEFIEADFSGLIDDWSTYALALSLEEIQTNTQQEIKSRGYEDAS